jgi:hypothetical protein
MHLAQNMKKQSKARNTMMLLTAVAIVRSLRPPPPAPWPPDLAAKAEE